MTWPFKKRITPQVVISCANRQEVGWRVCDGIGGRTPSQLISAISLRAERNLLEGGRGDPPAGLRSFVPAPGKEQGMI